MLRGKRLNRPSLGISGVLLFISILLMVSLPVTVTSAHASVTRTWTAPTINTNGTPLTDLAGYTLYYGNSSGNYTTTVNVGNVTTYTFTNLAAGTYYFAVTAYDTSGNQSAYSNEVVQTVSGTADTTAPTVTAFTIPATSTSLTVPITSFTATDNVGVTGYIITQSATAPAATASGWLAIAPTSYTATAAGKQTLYAYAKDAAGNVSAAKSASVTITLADTTPPTVTAFTIPATSTSLTIPITSFTATDNVGVTGYVITQSATAPAATASGWLATAPTSYTVSAAGKQTLYAYAKDAAGNVSAAKSASVTITLADTIPPTVTAFTVPATSASLNVPITSFTATDNVGVTGYIITQSATAPTATASGWSAGAPTAYTFSAAGTYTLYAWAEDAAGNVSTSKSATVSITLSASNTPSIIWRNTSTGQVEIWAMNGTSMTSNTIIGTVSSPWTVVGTGDFNQDGNPDLLLVNTSTGQEEVWYMNGSTVISDAYFSDYVPANWNIVGVGDFSGDGYPDLVLEDVSSGQTALWYTNGTAVTSGVYIEALGANTSWIIVGVGDFNQDGHPDLLLENVSTGQLAVWYMNGSTVTSGVYLQSTVPAGWSVVGVADFNGDGYPDILLRNSSTGANTIWYMNGVTVTGTASLPTLSAGWNVVGITSAGISMSDTTQPTLTAFAIPATSASLTVPITSFTATDNVGVTGYIITQSATAPAATASGWLATAPTSYTFSAAGTYTLYAWAEDAAGNVSTSKSATVTITLSDTTPPTVTAFTVPATSTSLNVPITSFTATDNVGVTGYMITQTATAPSATATGWLATAPISLTVSAAGTYTLYAYAKDAAGNVSAAKSASVTITLADTTPPTVTAFTVPATSASLNVPITSFTATDNVGVTGYIITQSATAPTATASGWSAGAPTAYTFSAAGTYTLYAWAEDAAGNVSTSKSATVSITLSASNTPSIIWRNTSTGQVEIWAMNGTSMTSNTIIGTVSSPWTVVGTGDFNQDGNPDLLLVNTSTGQEEVWYMNGSTVISDAYFSDYVPANWNIVGVGDFSGDGYPDLVLEDVSSGQTALWYTNGTAVTSGVYIEALGANTSWIIVGVGDFNQDGHPDLLLENVSTGQLAVWYMNGSTVTSGVYLQSTVPAGWSVVGVADFNGDGYPDILLRNSSTGANTIWYMNGVTVTGTASLPTLSAGWNVVGIE